MPLSVVILAAGQGKRMHSDLPKVLQPLAGQPLLQHVIHTARALHPADIYVVYGHGGAQVQAALHLEHVEWVLQADQLGTGHAVMQAMSLIPDDHTVLVLYGDVPLIGTASLNKLIAIADAGTLAILSVKLDEAAGYGRIVRDAKGHVKAIVEHHDANAEQRNIREANSGLLAAPAVRLREWLLGLGRDNAQREYYLTDVVAGAVRSGARVDAVPAESAAEVMGVNDKLQLAQVEACYRRRRAEALMLAGATLADPARIDVRGDVEVGRDVFIDINAVLVGKVRLSARVKVGPNCFIRDSTHRRRYGGRAELRDRQRGGRRTLQDRTLRETPARHGPASRRAHRQFRGDQEQRHRARQQGEPSELRGRLARGQGRQHRCGDHHVQLRRRQQMADGDR